MRSALPPRETRTAATASSRRAGRSRPSVDLRAEPGAAPARQGAGSVHHVAFRAADDAAESAMAAAVRELDLRPTDRIDRQYFHSVYFREPGGILFEIATDAPGFTGRRAEGGARHRAQAAVLVRGAARRDRGGAAAAGVADCWCRYGAVRVVARGTYEKLPYAKPEASIAVKLLTFPKASGRIPTARRSFHGPLLIAAPWSLRMSGIARGRSRIGVGGPYEHGARRHDAVLSHDLHRYDSRHAAPVRVVAEREPERARRGGGRPT